MKWLLTKLKESRDQRGMINRRQGVYQYKLANEKIAQQEAESKEVDPAKLKQIIFNGKPKRIYRTNQNQDMSL